MDGSQIGSKNLYNFLGPFGTTVGPFVWSPATEKREPPILINISPITNITIKD